MSFEDAKHSRYRFQDHPLPFRALFAAGFTYRNACYEYQGRVFRSTTELNEYFDQYATPEVISNLQSSVSSINNSTSDDDKEGRQLRAKVLRELEILTQSNNEVDSSNDSDDQEDTQKPAPQTEMSATKRRSSRIRPSSTTASTTSAEKGSALLMQKKTKRKLKNAPATESVDIPSVEECIQIAQTELQNAVYSQDYEQEFPTWRFLLTTNHSLLFFGAGSKYDLIQSFAEMELHKEGFVLTIDGFAVNSQDNDDNSNSYKSIDTILLDLLVQIFLNNTEPDGLSAVPLDEPAPPHVQTSRYRSHPTVERAIAISRALAHQACETLIPIFVVIHNIESALRSIVDHEALSALVSNSCVANGTHSVRLVATVDHLDGIAFWNDSNYWIWQQVDTVVPYTRELQFLAAEKQRQTVKSNRISQAINEVRVIPILQTLAPRYTDVLFVLARLHKNNDQQWVRFSALQDECKRSCVMARDYGLRRVLEELKDHTLVAMKREKAVDYLRIPHTSAKIREIIEYANSKK